jgi:hypothetical protein
MHHGTLDVVSIRNMRLARESLKERTGQGAGLALMRKSRDRQGRSWTTPFGSPRATGSVSDPESQMHLPHAGLQVPCGSI